VFSIPFRPSEDSKEKTKGFPPVDLELLKQEIVTAIKECKKWQHVRMANSALMVCIVIIINKSKDLWMAGDYDGALSGDSDNFVNSSI
jgi:hypothetical protein